MKRQRVTAILMSAILAFSACMPINSMTAFAAESGTTADAALDEETGSNQGSKAEAVEEAPSADEADDVSRSGDESTEDSAEEQTDEAAEETASADSTLDSEDEQAAASEEQGEAEDADTSEEQDEEEDADISEEQDSPETAQEQDSSETAQEQDDVSSESEQTSEEENAALESEQAEASATNSTEQAPEADDITEPADESVSSKNPALAGADASGSASYGETFEDATRIYTGDVLPVEFQEEGYGCACFKFIPVETGIYAFYSSDSNWRPRAGLYDADQNFLMSATDYGDGSDFRIETLFKQGNVYYFQTDGYPDEESYFSVHLERVLSNFYCQRVGSQFRTLRKGTEETLAVDAFASSALYYDWYIEDEDQNQTLIAGATSSSYTFTVTGEATYYCVVSDDMGNSSTIEFTIWIDNNLKAYAADSEDSLEYYDYYVNPGSRVTMNTVVSADDESQLTYQWYEQDGDDWNPIEGANGTSYTVNSVDHKLSYYVEVKDQYGNNSGVSFDIFIENDLKVYAVGPEGQSQSVNLHVEPGKGVNLSATVSAVDMSQLTYEWSKENRDTYDWEPVEGASGTSYTIDSVNERTAYRFRVTDQYDNEREVYFYISISNNLQVDFEDGQNDGYPRTLYVKSAESVYLSAVVSAIDKSQMTYKWFRSYSDEDDDDWEWDEIVGANDTSYTVSYVDRNVYYLFKVTDRFGTEDSIMFHLCVDNHLKAYAEGSEDESTDYNVPVAPGESFILSVTVSALYESQITYHWYHREDETQEWKSLDGYTGAWIQPGWIRKNHEYYVQVRDIYGNKCKVYFHVYVDNQLKAYAAGPEGECTNYTFYVEPGLDANMSAVVTAITDAGMTYQWYRWDDQYNVWTLIEGANDKSYMARNVDRNCKYYFEVTDCVGSSCKVYYNITVETSLRAYPEGAEEGSFSRFFEVDQGESVRMSAIVSADSDCQLTYQWRRRFSETDEFRIVEDAEGTSYTLENATRDVDYWLQVTDQYGASCDVYFIIHVKIDNHLRAYAVDSENESTYFTYRVNSGDNVCMSAGVSAEDQSSLTYTWHYINADNQWAYMEGENSTSCTVNNVRQNGQYYFEVTDQYENSCRVYFTINIDNHLSACPEGSEAGTRHFYVVPGESVRMAAVVYADDESDLTYQWEKYNNETFIYESVEGAADISYTIDSASEDAEYLLRIKDKYNNECTVGFRIHVMDFEYAQTITVEEPYTAGLVPNMGPLLFRFTPAQSGTFAFYSTDGEGNLCAKLYDETYSLLAAADNSEEGTDFRLEYDLSEGETYYILILSSDNGSGDSYTLHIEEPEPVRQPQILRADDLTLKYGISGTITVTGAQGALSFESSNLEIVEPYEDGTLIPISVGSAVITISAAETEGYLAAEPIQINVEVLPASFEDAIVKVDGSGFVYDGKPKTPGVIATLYGNELTEGIDYYLEYSNNVNVGKATVTLKPINNVNRYVETASANFTIARANQSITAKASASSVAVGKTVTVSITGAKGTKSYSSSDTTIATVDRSTGKVTAKKVGTVKITATSAATTNYNAASKTVTIKVVPAATASLSAANQATGIKLTWKKVTGANGYKVYRGSTLIKTITSGSTVTFTDTKANTNGTKYTFKVVAKAATGDSTLSKSISTYRVARPTISSLVNTATRKMTIKWAKNAKATGYQIQYSTGKTFASGTKTITVANASTVSKVVTSLTKGKVYYVRMRTYKTVGSVKYYSVWSAVKSIKISK